MHLLKTLKFTTFHETIWEIEIETFFLLRSVSEFVTLQIESMKWRLQMQENEDDVPLKFNEHKWKCGMFSSDSEARNPLIEKRRRRSIYAYEITQITQTGRKAFPIDPQDGSFDFTARYFFSSIFCKINEITTGR